MNRGLTVSLRCASDELFFSRTSPLRITAGGLSGFDYPETALSLEDSADGRRSYTKGVSVCPRQLSIRFEVTVPEDFHTVRDRVNRMMSPGRVLTLATLFLGRRRTIEVLASKAPEYIFETLSDTVQIVLSFTAPKPYFTEGVLYRSSVPTAKAVLTFPAGFIKGEGATFSFAGPKNAAVIHNPGDASCPITLYLYAEGTVREPYVMLGKKKIRLTGTLEAGDVLKIVSGDGNHSIAVNGTVRYDLDRKSRFFTLSPGENTAVLGASSGASNLRGAFVFMPRYYGM